MYKRQPRFSLFTSLVCSICLSLSLALSVPHPSLIRLPSLRQVLTASHCFASLSFWASIMSKERRVAYARLQLMLWFTHTRALPPPHSFYIPPGVFSVRFGGHDTGVVCVSTPQIPVCACILDLACREKRMERVIAVAILCWRPEFAHGPHGFTYTAPA